MILSFTTAVYWLCLHYICSNFYILKAELNIKNEACLTWCSLSANSYMNVNLSLQTVFSSICSVV